MTSDTQRSSARAGGKRPGPLPGGRSVLTAADRGALVGAFAAGAAEAERRGLDGVELHGAHGYLRDRFLWSTTDRWASPS